MSHKIYEVKIYGTGADDVGTTEWRLGGKLHREDGPAVAESSGYKAWYQHGKLHRLHGPAIEYHDGSKAWHLDGKLHREDGPAIEYANGRKEWYLHGVCLNEDEFNTKMKLNSAPYIGKVVTIDGNNYKLTNI